MSRLFIKFKPYLDFTYFWEFPTKLIIPPRPDFTSIYLEELAIKKITNHKYCINEETRYAYSSYIDARKKALKLHSIMLHNNEHLVQSNFLELSIAHYRYIKISHANLRITNILKNKTS